MKKGSITLHENSLRININSLVSCDLHGDDEDPRTDDQPRDRQRFHVYSLAYFAVVAHVSCTTMITSQNNSGPAISASLIAMAIEAPTPSE